MREMKSENSNVPMLLAPTRIAIGPSSNIAYVQGTLAKDLSVAITAIASFSRHLIVKDIWPRIKRKRKITSALSQIYVTTQPLIQNISSGIFVFIQEKSLSAVNIVRNDSVNVPTVTNISYRTQNQMARFVNHAPGGSNQLILKIIFKDVAKEKLL